MERRELPVALWIAFALDLVGLASRVAMEHGLFSVRVAALTTGVDVAGIAVAAAGLGELARRSHGIGAVALRIAMWATVGWIALSAVFQCLPQLTSYSSRLDSLYATLSIVWLVVSVARTCALATAAVIAVRRPAVRAVGVAVAALTLVTFIPRLGSSDLVGTAFALILAASQLALAAMASRAATTHTSDRAVVAAAVRGLSTSLWIRIWAVAGGVLLALLAVGARSQSVIVAAMAGAPVINLLGQVWFAIAALGLARGLGQRESRGRVYAGAILIAIASAVAMVQTAALGGMLFQVSTAWGDGAEIAQRLTVIVPALAVLGMTLVASAVVAALTRAGEVVVAGTVVSRIIWFVVFAAIAIALQGGVLDREPPEHTIIPMMMFMALANVIAIVALARACRDAAAALGASNVELPTARLL